MNQSWENGATDRRAEKRKHGRRWIHRTSRGCNQIKIKSYWCCLQYYQISSSDFSQHLSSGFSFLMQLLYYIKTTSQQDVHVWLKLFQKFLSDCGEIHSLRTWGGKHYTLNLSTWGSQKIISYTVKLKDIITRYLKL